MTIFLELTPWLLAMLVLMAVSAFTSGSEAALFYLRPREREAMRQGNRGERAAYKLLHEPDRLLSAVLFWNLVVNLLYFAVVSIISIRLERSETAPQSAAAAFALLALLAMIFFSEMLPKSLAVLGARRLASWCARPLAVAVRVVDPLMPVLRLVMTLSQRLIWPGFKPEPYLHVQDLERAIELSTDNQQLLAQEQTMLNNVVSLSSIRVEEWMRPRTQYVAFIPPVSLADLGGKMTSSGYLLVTEPDSEEIASAVNLQTLSHMPKKHLERLGQPVIYTPWCASVGDALELMAANDRAVAAVVNEFGETIGILTFEDVLDTIFTYNPSRSKRLLDRNPIHPISPGMWLVAGVTSLRRLARLLDLELPPSKSVTIAGVIQETLQRLVQAGDECDWGPFHFRVLEAPQRGHMVIEMTRVSGEDGAE